MTSDFQWSSKLVHLKTHLIMLDHNFKYYIINTLKESVRKWMSKVSSTYSINMKTFELPIYGLPGYINGHVLAVKSSTRPNRHTPLEKTDFVGHLWQI